MANHVCPQCGAPNTIGAKNCKYCGEALAIPFEVKQQQQVDPVYRQMPPNQQQVYQQAQQGYQQPQQPQYQQAQQGYQQPQQPQYQQSQQGYQQPQQYQQQPQQVYVQPQNQSYSTYVEPPAPVIDPHWPIKSKGLAAFLAVFFGTLGFHKFYLGKTGWGIIYILFSWTLIPTALGLIEGLIYLSSNNHNFMMKHHVQLKNEI